MLGVYETVFVYAIGTMAGNKDSSRFCDPCMRGVTARRVLLLLNFI